MLVIEVHTLYSGHHTNDIPCLFSKDWHATAVTHHLDMKLWWWLTISLLLLRNVLLPFVCFWIARKHTCFEIVWNSMEVTSSYHKNVFAITWNVCFTVTQLEPIHGLLMPDWNICQQQICKFLFFFVSRVLCLPNNTAGKTMRLVFVIPLYCLLSKHMSYVHHVITTWGPGCWFIVSTPSRHSNLHICCDWILIRCDHVGYMWHVYQHWVR